jgi:hypothetical protein
MTFDVFRLFFVFFLVFGLFLDFWGGINMYLLTKAIHNHFSSETVSVSTVIFWTYGKNGAIVNQHWKRELGKFFLV